jgi:hypothetical protein
MPVDLADSSFSRTQPFFDYPAAIKPRGTVSASARSASAATKYVVRGVC